MKSEQNKLIDWFLFDGNIDLMWAKNIISIIFFAWKVSKCGIFSGLHFPVFSPSTGKYGPEKNTYLDTFRAVFLVIIDFFISFLKLPLHKVCRNTGFHWPVFSHIRTESKNSDRVSENPYYSIFYKVFMIYFLLS